MRINHRRAHILVPKQLLDSPYIIAVLEQMGGEGVAKGVAGSRLCHISFANRSFDSVLEVFFAHMVALLKRGARVTRSLPGGKDILPAPFPGGRRHLPLQGAR